MIWLVILLTLALAWTAYLGWAARCLYEQTLDDLTWVRQRYEAVSAQLTKVQKEGWSVEVPAKSGCSSGGCGCAA